MGYGEGVLYGLGKYKGDSGAPALPIITSTLIDQYAKSYSNGISFDSVITATVVEPSVIVVGSITAIGLIEQYSKEYINGN